MANELRKKDPTQRFQLLCFLSTDPDPDKVEMTATGTIHCCRPAVQKLEPSQGRAQHLNAWNQSRWGILLNAGAPFGCAYHLVGVKIIHEKTIALQIGLQERDDSCGSARHVWCPRLHIMRSC